MSLVFQSQKMAGKPHIIEIEFRRFHQPFGDIGKIRRQSKYDIACLQKGQPVPRRLMGNTTIGAQTVKIEQLSHTAGTQGDKTLKKN